MNSLRKQVTLCTIGSVFEWYEFMVFALLTPIISRLFFPHTNHFAAMMSTFAIFASGYIMRPIGALFFGHLGDTLGRKYTLMITLFLMTGSTFAMGCIPVGSSFSAMILLLCRLAQGFSASGEYPAALTLLAEQSSRKRKGFITSIAVFGTGLGCFLGAVLCAIIFKSVGHEAMLNGGWRIPFLLAVPFGITSYLLRKNIYESDEFKTMAAQNKTLRAPIKTLITQHSKNLMAMLSISILANVIIYVNLIYISNYAMSIHKINTIQNSHLYLIATFVYTLSIIFFGFISDYVNKKLLLITTCVLILIFTYPLLQLAFHGTVDMQFLAQAILSLFSGMILGSFSAVLADSFPTAVRYTGLSVTLNFAGSLFGGTAPFVCGWLTKYFDSTQACAYYIILLTIIALSAIIFRVELKTEASSENIMADFNA